MVDNRFVQCNYCSTKIRLRFQLGFFNIPFDICCPKCGVHFHGEMKIVDETSFRIYNASPIVCSIDDVDYYADLSVELPCKKIEPYNSEKQILEAGFSPFLSTHSLMGSDAYLKVAREVGALLRFRSCGWQQLSPLYNLYFAGNASLAKDHFLNYSSAYVVENELDASMALHQLTLFGLSHMLPSDTMQQYMACSNSILKEVGLRKVVEFISILGGSQRLNDLSKKVFKQYTRWFEDIEKYIPAIMLSLSHSTSEVDKTKVGISTSSFEDMISFYADSYEVVLEMIGVAVGLNNIIVRNDFNAFHPNTKLQDYKAFSNLVKSQRINALIEEEPFSKSIPIQRHVRNAIAHYDYEYDRNTQVIQFHDQYKGKENTVELYLLDLALLCYENIQVVVYLNELLYNLKKVDYIQNGMKLHIKAISGDDANISLLFNQ